MMRIIHSEHRPKIIFGSWNCSHGRPAGPGSHFFISSKQKKFFIRAGSNHIKIRSEIFFAFRSQFGAVMKSSAAVKLIKYEVRLSVKEVPVGHAFLFISYVRHSAVPDCYVELVSVPIRRCYSSSERSTTVLSSIGCFIWENNVAWLSLAAAKDIDWQSDAKTCSLRAGTVRMANKIETEHLGGL